MKLKVLKIALCLGLASTANAADRTESEQPGNGGEPTSYLDALVVVGEKQDRSLKDTTSSVSVVGEEKLRTTQAVTVRDAIKDIPNVLALDGVVPNIRGVEANGAAGGFFGVAGGANARVSMLVDGVPDPFLAVFAGDAGLWDLEQIEVYRGPQSTNNGRNSIAGSIFLKTKDPTFDWEGKVRLGYRDQEEYFDKSLMLSGPIVDDILAFRLTSQILDAETLVNNQAVAGNPSHYDFDEINADRHRFKLLWTPTADFDALLTYSTGEEQGPLGRRYYSNETDYILPFPQDQRVENDSLSLKLGYAFSEDTSLDVLIAGKDYLYGYDSYAATPAQEQQFFIQEDSATVDAKLNFGQNKRHVYGHIGLAYFDREQDISSVGSFVYDGDDSSDSRAVYGEINYALTEQLTLTGGMRYQKEKQDRRFVNVSPFVVNLNVNTDENMFLPSLALQYDVTPDTRVGLSAKKGYNSAGGAVNPRVGVPFVYDKETVNAYEFTVRSSFADDAVSLRANVFYNDYSDYQASSGLAIINVEEATTYGAEVEAIAWVAENLELNLGLGLLRSKIEDGGAIPGVDGNDLSFAPESTITLGVTWFVNEKTDISANLRYTSSYFVDLQNTQATEVDGYTTANLNANYENGPWLISGFINNLTDERHVVNHSFFGTPFAAVEVLEPRTLGASVTYSFF